MARLVSFGNSKLPKTTAIFNMSTAKDCPSKKLGLCAACKQNAKCYAIKAERLYPNTLPHRNRQHEYWKNVSANEFSSMILSINSKKRIGLKALRFNESGDFLDQDSVNKADQIAKTLYKNKIIAYCYTSRSDLDYSKVKHLKIMGSNFKKTGIASINKIIGKKDKKPKGFSICPGSCKSCRICLKRNVKVALIKH